MLRSSSLLDFFIIIKLIRTAKKSPYLYIDGLLLNKSIILQSFVVSTTCAFDELTCLSVLPTIKAAL